MKISPYISFAGNAAEAIAFYEKAFSATAEILRYKDAPQEHGYQTPAELENYVMHGQIKLGSESIMFCDSPPEYPVNVGHNIVLTVEFDDGETLKAAYEALKEGGEVAMELQETFWSKAFASVTDKFSISWNLTLTMTN